MFKRAAGQVAKALSGLDKGDKTAGLTSRLFGGGGHAVFSQEGSRSGHPFFSDVMDRVTPFWNAYQTFRAHDVSEIGFNPRAVVYVELNADGSLANTVVRKSSGLGFLDAHAVEAVEKAQPFPAPPRELLRDRLLAFSISFCLQFNRRRARC